MNYINATRISNRNASGILVALLDGGLDVMNPVFEGNIWSSSHKVDRIEPVATKPEIAVHPFYGIDFTDPSNLRSNPLPCELEPYHATQVASIIGGKPTPVFAQGGIAHSLEIMPLKVMPAFNGCAIEPVVKAVEFAMAQGVHILNCSFILYGQDPRLKAVFKEAIESGILIIAAAGNDDEDIENYPGYPGNLDSHSVITVGAIQSDLIDHLSHCSNFGSLVDIAAPGDGGLYTGPHKRLKHPPGKTSFAAAYVSGVAALVWSQVVDKGLSRPEQANKVRELILNGARRVTPLEETGDFDPRVKTWGDRNPVLDMSFLVSH